MWATVKMPDSKISEQTSYLALNTHTHKHTLTHTHINTHSHTQNHPAG